MANGSGVAEDLPVVATLECLVSEEVDVLVGDSLGLLGFVFEVLQAVSLVPAVGEDIEGDLATNGEAKQVRVSRIRWRKSSSQKEKGGRWESEVGSKREHDVRKTEVSKTLLEGGNKLLSNLGVLVKGLEVVPLLGAGIPSDGADVDHAVAELNKGSPLDGDVQISDVVQAEVDELLVLRLADPADEAVGREGLAQLVRREAVLGEAEVEEGGDGDAGGLADLFLLLDEVGAADEADGALLAEGLEEGEDLGRGILGVRTAVSAKRWNWDRGVANWRGDLVAKKRRYKCFFFQGLKCQLTRRAGVNVPSTSKRQIVSFKGRSSRGV